MVDFNKALKNKKTVENEPVTAVETTESEPVTVAETEKKANELIGFRCSVPESVKNDLEAKASRSKQDIGLLVETALKVLFDLPADEFKQRLSETIISRMDG